MGSAHRSQVGMTQRAFQTLAVLLVLGLTGCGTNIPKLLQDDSKLAWEGEEAILLAEDQNLSVTNAYYDAETEKYHSCRPIYRAADERIERESGGNQTSLLDQFLGDLMLLGALLVPVPEIEDCAQAVERYQRAYVALTDQTGSY